MVDQQTGGFVSAIQIAAILACTLALFFLVAFATKSLDAFRLKAWRDRLELEIAQMERDRDRLREELERRQTMAWIDEQLRDAGMLPEGVVSVIPVPAREEGGEGSPIGDGYVRSPRVDTEDVKDAGTGLFRNPHWEAWLRTIRGFD